MRYFHDMWNLASSPLAGSAPDSFIAAIADKASEVHAGPANLLLDIGAGRGAGHKLMESLPIRRFSVDISPLAFGADWPSALSSRVVADGCALPFRDSTFDIVTLLDLLSICTSPLAMLREACRVMRPGATMIVNAQAMDDDTRLRYDPVNAGVGFDVRMGSSFVVKFFEPWFLEEVFAGLSLDEIHSERYELAHDGHLYQDAAHVHRYCGYALRKRVQPGRTMAGATVECP